MKHTLIALTLITLMVVGCKQNKKSADDHSEDNRTEHKLKLDKNGLAVVSGDFIYTDQAAVINAKNAIYGVVLDSMAEVLSKKVDPVKRDKYDMVPVTIKGKVKPNPQKDGWDKVIEIRKILMISKPKGDRAIKMDSGKKKINLNNQNKQNT